MKRQEKVQTKTAPSTESGSAETCAAARTPILSEDCSIKTTAAEAALTVFTRDHNVA